jgi:hypothetical protein
VPFKSFRFTGFNGGVYASANIFDQPSGTIARGSNLVQTRRGALQTVDGSSILCQPAAGFVPTGGFPPIASINSYTPSGIANVPNKLFGLTLADDGTCQIVDMTNATWDASSVIGTFANSGPIVGGCQFSQSYCFALGIKVPLQIYRSGPPPTLQALSNTFQPDTNYPTLADLLGSGVPLGAHMITTATDGSTYIYKCTNQGTLGDTDSTVFPSTYLAKVIDKSGGTGAAAVTWQNVGLASTNPPGAAYCFSHLNSLWLWGTAQTKVNDVDGPDSLRMSDSGAPTSFNPINQSFIGLGDGQFPMGGGVWTQLEVGIPATAQLVLFKTRSTYSVVGQYPLIQITEIPDGVGCLAPDTIQFVPGIGLMRMSQYGVAVFNGTRDVVDKYTDPIRPYLFGTTLEPESVNMAQIMAAFALQTINPPGYLMVCPLRNTGGIHPPCVRGFFFDRVLQSWSVIDFPMQLAGGTFRVSPSDTSTLTMSVVQRSQSLVGGWNDGIIRQIFNGDEFFDNQPATPITWSFRLQAVGAPTTPLYLRRGSVHASLLGSVGSIKGMSVLDQNRNGYPDFGTLYLPQDTTALTQTVDIGQTVMGGPMLILTGAGRVVVEGLEIQYSPKRLTRVPG